MIVDVHFQHPLERLYRWEAVFEHFFRLSEDDQAKIFGGNAERILRQLNGDAPATASGVPLRSPSRPRPGSENA